MAIKVLVTITILMVLKPNSYCQAEEEEHPNGDLGNFADLAAELFQSQGAEGLSSVVQGLMGSAISGALSGDGGDDKAGGNLGQVLRGLGNMVGPNARGIDTEVLGGLFGLLSNSLDPKRKDQGGIDVLSMLSTVGGVLSQPGNAKKLEQVTGYMPLVMDFLSAMYGPEAHDREKRHAGHSWLFPPIVERFHVFADHFMHSDFGRQTMQIIGAEKVIKIFSDETGKFSYDKFVELMENHSFRRHWIHMFTLRMGKFIEFYTNPKNFEHYTSMVDLLINTYLNQQGYPRAVHLAKDDPAESISSIINFLSEKFLGMQLDSKFYVEPVVSYAKNLYQMIKDGSQARGGTEGISAKLADSINLEIIEPVARVNRAYRYLKKNPSCDKYVLCLVNQRGPETETLPGLKILLSRGTSFLASWALSSLSGGSMMDYFNVIMYQDECHNYFKPECSDYHDEEVKVTTEYIHNEL